MICSKHGLLQEPTFFDFLQEKLITLVPFSIAIIAIVKYAGSLLWLLVYFAIIGSHMLHILLQRCPHCAYYQTESRWLTCLWWRWVPKLRKSDSAPLPKYLGYYTPIAVLTITFFPVYWLTFQWEYFLLYFLSWGVLAMSIVTAGCSRCLDFKCKNNLVPDEMREAYLSEMK